MDRVPYRRVTPPRDRGIDSGRSTYIHRAASKPESEPITGADNFKMQLTICALLMLAVFAICLVDIGPFVTLRTGLRQVMAGATTFGELAADVRGFGQQQNAYYPPIYELPVPMLPFPPIVYEEILPPTAYEMLNPQTPGPLVVPGLWD